MNQKGVNFSSELENMQAMIFSAGLGTRFKPWTNKHPKALAVINGKTLLQRNIEYVQGYGIRQVVVNVHHFANQVIEALDENKGWGNDFLISDETTELLDTGGGLLQAAHLFVPNQTFLTCNADILTDININELLAFHRANKALISFAVSNRKTSRLLLFDANHQLTGWRNTQTGEEKGPILSFTEAERNSCITKAYNCIALFEYDVFAKMKAVGFSGKFSLIEAYLQLATDNKVLGFTASGDRWVDVGKPEAIAIAEQLFGS